MESMTFKQFKAGQGYFGDREVITEDLTAEGLKDNDIIINFAYTDYGGDFFDRVCIKFFEDRKEKTFVSHNTAYYGKNGILWGTVAQEFLEASSRYPLGYDSLEDFYYTMEREAQEAQADEFLNEYKGEDGEPLTDKVKQDSFSAVVDKLSEYSIMSSGVVDICEDTLINALENFLNGKYKMILSQERERIADGQYIGKIS